MPELIGKKEACSILGGISEATLWRGVREGRFPKPLKLGRFIARWRREDLAACIEKLAAQA